jgi:DNA-binding NtrC family response regulator
MLVNTSDHSNDLFVALLSNDDNLANIVYPAVEMPWRLERQFYNRGVAEFLRLGNARLVIVDDEVVSEGDRGWLLAQVKRNLNDAMLLYIAGNHSIETERRARGKGAGYYTAKPIQSDEFRAVLQGFMNQALRGDDRKTRDRAVKNHGSVRPAKPSPGSSRLL